MSKDLNGTGLTELLFQFFPKRARSAASKPSSRSLLPPSVLRLPLDPLPQDPNPTLRSQANISTHAVQARERGWGHGIQ